MKTETHWDELSNLPFKESYPTPEASARLYDELQFQRASQVYLWALGPMNLYSMRVASEKAFGGDSYVVPMWKDRPNANTIVTTANPDVIYTMSYLDLKKEGPTVVDLPPQMQGMLENVWHRPITDIGFPGPDQGQGGKYLVLPPDYEGKVPEGYLVFKSPTYRVFLFLRGFFKGDNLAPTVASMETLRVYPLAKKDNPPKMQFPNASRPKVDMDYPRDIRYFENLAKFLDEEPAVAEDFTMRGMAASIGIAKGVPFAPDAYMKAILQKAADVAYKMATNVSYNSYGKLPGVRVYPDRQWETLFLSGSPFFHTPTHLSFDEMIAFYHKAYSISPAMVIKMPGKGAQYVASFHDSDGDYFSGERSYTLHIPANAPAENFWSIVLYDTETRALLDNGQPFPAFASNSGKMKLNADGSADFFFGPTAPKDAKFNWITTVPGKGYFPGVRFYAPTQAFFDKSWKPGDVEKVK